MPEYVYRADDGEEYSLWMSMRDKHPETIAVVRSAGEPDTVVHDPPSPPAGGKIFRRVFGNCLVEDMSHAAYPYASLRLKGTPAAQGCERRRVEVRGIVHDDVPIVRSPQHERELCERYGLVRE